MCMRAARDYVEGMWRMLQQPAPEDFVLATGETHPVREFVEKAFAVLDITIKCVYRLICICSMCSFSVFCFQLERRRRKRRGRGCEDRQDNRESGYAVLPSCRSRVSVRLRLDCACSTPHISLLLGNPEKAERLLGWKRKVDFESLVKEMVEADLKAAKSLVEDQN